MHMSDEVLQKISDQFSTFPKRSYPKGQILVFADENPEHIFYITKGRVRKYGISYRGDEVIVNLFKPPAFFPMSWVLNRTPNKYFYKTEVDTELHVVPVEVAAKFIEENPDVALDLLRRVYSGIEGILGRIVHLMSSSARNRLIYEIVIECERFGEQQKDGSYEIFLSEQDLASRAGLTRETVSREMRRIKTDFHIAIGSGKLTVRNVDELKRAIGETHQLSS